MPKPLRRILLLVILTLAYVLILPRSTGTEPLLDRRWVLSIDDATADGSAEDGAEAAAAGEDAAEDGAGEAPGIIPFRLGSRFGYFTSDGRLTHSEQIRYGVAQDAERYANYSVISENIVLQNPDGDLVRSIAAHGYPRLERGRLYVFAPGGSAVSEWTVDGRRIWTQDFLSVLTDLASGEVGTAVGLLDGSVYLLGEDGEELFSYETEGSRLAVTLAVALGEDEDVLAAVAGIDPQKLILFERHTEGFFPVFQLELDSDYRRSVLLDFLDGGATLAVEQPGGLVLYDRRTESFGRVDLGGAVEEVQSLPEFDLVVTASRGDGGAEAPVRRLQATVWPDYPLFAERMPADDIFLRAEGARIYLGMNGRLLCVRLARG